MVTFKQKHLNNRKLGKPPSTVTAFGGIPQNAVTGLR